MADATAMLGHSDPAAGRVVEELFRGAASRVRTRLVNRLGTDLPVGPVSLVWVQLGQVLQQLPAGTAVATFRIDPSGLTGLVAIEPELLARLVGQILGQTPDHAWSGAPDRLPSRFDLVVARRIAEDVLGGVAEVLPDSVGTKIEVGQVGSAARVAPGIPRTALVGSVSYDVVAPGGVPGRIELVVPSEITRLAAPSRPPRQSDAGRGIERVLPLPVTAVAELHRLVLPLAVVKRLHVGQVLELGPSRDVVLRVGERATLLGEAGVQNAVRSVRVKGRVEGGILK
jgi:flagellar motor switch protein FliM